MAKTIDGTLYLTVEEAADTLATTAMRVLMLLREKALIGVELEGEWLVTAGSVAGCRNTGPGTMTTGGCANACASTGGCACTSTER